jgi:hypothetical protein
MLTVVARGEVGVFLAAFVLLVGYRLLTGQINTRRLLADKDTREFSLARLQMLVVTILGAGYWFIWVLDPRNGNVMPEIPQDLLLLLAGSHSLYLAAKSLPLVQSALVQDPRSNS